MKATTVLREPRPYYTPALVALAAIHESHGAVLGGNFVDCNRCRFHAHNGSHGKAIEHDGNYSFTRTYAVQDGDLVVTDERIAEGAQRQPTYGELRDALRKCALIAEAIDRGDDSVPAEYRGKTVRDIYEIASTQS